MTTDRLPPLAERALAKRVLDVPPSGIRRFFDILATMDDVISLGVGEPDFDTPRAIVEAASSRCARAAPTTPRTTGRWSCAGRSRRSRAALRRPLRPGDGVLITVGASEALDLALRATFDPGDEVILHEPSYVAYVPAIIFAGGTVRHVATRLEDDFALDPDAVEAAITPRTKALFLGYPCNPTGAVLPPAVRRAGRHRGPPRPAGLQRRDLRPACLRRLHAPGVERAARDARADHPHGRLLEGVRDDRLAGRLRRGAGSDPRGIVKVHQYGIMSAPTMAQDAALVAVIEGEPDVERMRAEYDRRRRLIVDGLNALGLDTFEPRGAFYAFPRITSTGLTDDAFTEGLLTQERVAVVPGSAFGPSGAGHVRMCYATSYERLEEALRRIGRFVERTGAG